MNKSFEEIKKMADNKIIPLPLSITVVPLSTTTMLPS